MWIASFMCYLGLSDGLGLRMYYEIGWNITDDEMLNHEGAMFLHIMGMNMILENNKFIYYEHEKRFLACINER